MCAVPTEYFTALVGWLSSDSNLDHRAKVKLRFMAGGAWGAMMGMPSAHYALDMQSSRDRLTASKVERD